MRFIPTKFHAPLDYIVGAALIAAPWIFQFSEHTAATVVPIILGIGLIAYSLFTNYELGIWKVAPMAVHNLIDIAAGALLAGFVVCGIGIGLANPTIAGAALRVVDPSRTGMASGISNTCRLGGLAVGVAALGVLLQHRIGVHLAAAGYHGKSVSAAVASSGLRAAAGDARLAHAADVAFVSGLRLVVLTSCLTLLVGVGASLLVRTRRADAPEPATAPAS